MNDSTGRMSSMVSLVLRRSGILFLLAFALLAQSAWAQRIGPLVPDDPQRSKASSAERKEAVRPPSLQLSLPSPAAVAGHEGIARLLIDAGADVNYVMPESTSSVSGISALIFAANQGSESLVRLLIDAGADVNYKVPGRRGTTALKVARGRGHKDTAKLLRKAGAKR